MKNITRIALLILLAVGFQIWAPKCQAERRLSRGYSRAETTAEIIEKLNRFPSDSGLLINLKDSLKTETDPLLRQQGLAVVSTAMLIKGETEAGLKALKVLEKHYPDSKYTAALTIGNIAAPCPNCNGEGRVWRACPVCDGSGKCQMCQGSGRFEMKLDEGGETVCPKCGGSGECTSCEGTGRKYRQCHKCRGMGYLLDREDLLKAYADALKGKPKEPDTDSRKIIREKVEEEDEDVLRYF